jgi:nicotinamide-nucleotide amidase
VATTPEPAEQTDLRSHLAERDLTVAVAESLTGGLLASRFAQAEGASDWFRGAVVAYTAEVKHRLLGVRPGPVVSRQAAVDMARGARHLLDADVAVAVTGVGGPEPQDDLPPGTVWVAVAVDDCEAAELHTLEGDPARVCAASCDVAIALLLTTIERSPAVLHADRSPGHGGWPRDPHDQSAPVLAWGAWTGLDSDEPR